MGKKLDRFLARLSFRHTSAIDVRSKCGHFRILVIGRANAGKTTLLKKVYMSVEDPEIFGPNGKKVPLTALLLNGDSYPL